jgi:hypothetical protein
MTRSGQPVLLKEELSGRIRRREKIQHAWLFLGRNRNEYWRRCGRRPGTAATEFRSRPGSSPTEAWKIILRQPILQETGGSTGGLV